MATLDLPDFYIKLDNPNDDILKLMKFIKPEWDLKDINIKPIIGGYSNSVYHVYIHDEVDNSVIVRIRNIFSNEEIIGSINRVSEKKIVEVLSTLGIFSKVFAFFKNGYCYQYIQGKPLININPEGLAAVHTSVEMKNLPYKLIAKKLAEIHCVKIDGEDFSKTTDFSIYSKLLETTYPDIPHSTIVDKNIIRKEHEELLGYLKKFSLNIVLCHGDPNCGNMVWDKKQDKLTFVDWEDAHIGYQAYDVASFPMSLTFLEFAHIPGLPIYNKAIAVKLRDNFVRAYLEEYFCLSTGNLDVPEDYYEEFDRQVKLCSLIWLINVHIIIGSCMEECKNKEKWKTNVLPMALNSFKYYMKIKDETLHHLNLTNIL